MKNSSFAQYFFLATFLVGMSGCSSNPSAPRYGQFERDESIATYFAKCAAQVQALKPIQVKMGVGADEIKTMERVSSDYYERAAAFSDKDFVLKVSGEEIDSISNMASSDANKVMEYVVHSSKKCVDLYSRNRDLKTGKLKPAAAR